MTQLKKDETGITWCLREIAQNIEEYKFYGIRIGFSKLTCESDGYNVTDWDGHQTHHKDLFDAIGRFIEVNGEE